MGRRYTQHGRRHGPNGSDPILGFGPTVREIFSNSTGVTIADDATENLSWEYNSLDVLLDLTDPTQPTVIAGGVYAVTVTAVPDSLTVGGKFDLVLLIDPGGEGAGAEQSSGTSIAADQNPAASCSLTYYMPAGTVIQASVHSNDGAASADFFLTAVVQQIS